MVIEILTMLKAWPSEYQLYLSLFSFAIGFVLCYTILWGFGSLLKRILVPDTRIEVKEVIKMVKPEYQECTRTDNLTGECLRKEGCKTRSQCDYMLNEPE